MQGILVQVSQVLGDELQLGRGCLEELEQLQTGARLPVPLLGAFGPGRDGPVGVEGPEVVDADGVVQPGTPVDALLPEQEYLPLVALPVIEGVAPELALSGEGVWGYTGCRSQTALTVHLEQLRVEVELCAVAGQIDGDVPHNANSLLIGVVLQVEPLLIEDVLKEGVEGHPLGVWDGLLRPLAAISLILVVEGGEFGVVLQPWEVELLRHLGPAAGKAEERLIEQVHPRGLEMGIVHPVGGVPSGGLHLLMGEQAHGHQLVQVDEIGIACKSGGGHIGGIAVAGGDQGQDLPIGLSGVRQKVHEPAGRRAQRADAVGTGQRGDSQQDTAGA